jgi:asparagine synthase (glutamine-hydrolysing)
MFIDKLGGIKMSSKIKIKYFSGYIRNWRALCHELSISETLGRKEREYEIIEKAYIKWNLSMMEHIFGMFAIAIWDDEKKRLFCIRDQVGQKQMFYTVAENKFLCSGDINEIADASEKKLNLKMLQQYLFYGYPIGNETFYQGIYKLLPGHYAEWDGEKVTVKRYWKPEFEPDRTLSTDEWAEKIKAIVETILDEEKNDKEFPYKESFLSGGVDSSYLFAASDASCANTIGYEVPGFDESELARNTAKAVGKDFRVKVITPKEYFERIPTVMDKMGQPLGDASAVAFSLGCSAVKQYSDIVYSGEGIDEFFGGYNAHKNPLKEDWVYLTCSHIMSEEVVKSLMLDYNANIKAVDPIMPLWKETDGQDELSRKLTIDISFWLEGDIYLNTDRTSTACGIELHTPFSDLRLFDIARKIPTEYKFMLDQNKYVFRKAASSKLPDEVAFRKKVGFAVPIRKWLADDNFNAPVIEALFGDTSKRFFNQDALKELWERYIGGEDFLWSRIYALYVFIVWYDLKF